MTKMIKVECGFPPALREAIQEYADLFCDGNFRLAVRQLSRIGLAKI